MFVERYGGGQEAFFCLHGWSGDRHTFDPLLPFLPAGARMLAADLPGCGQSPEPHRWSLPAVTQEIVEAIEETGERVTLVGTCIGALLAMCAARECPDLVRRLVVIDAFARWPWYFRVFTARGWGKYAYASTFANPAGRWITNAALASRRTDSSDLTSGFVTMKHAAALEYLRILGEIASPAEFRTLSLPVDVIFGERTFRAARESAAVWQQMWPWARVSEIRGAGHLAIGEAAPAIARIVFEGVPCPQHSMPTSSSNSR
jgi:pimeloyl-ACP methyl ester carboxylesterase